MLQLPALHNTTFIKGTVFDTPIWEALYATDIRPTSMFVTNPNYIKHSRINNTDGVVTWVDVAQKGNYLYADTNKPSLVLNHALFNNNPGVVFSNEGNQRLLFKYPITAKTIIIVYYSTNTESYLIYAPRVIQGVTPGDDIWFDTFATSLGQLWTECTLSQDVVYSATSRINGKVVAPNIYPTPDTARVLTVTNLPDVAIRGFGGRVGQPNGTRNKYTLENSLSVQGGIAAILTFDIDVPEADLINFELALASMYINYNGIAMSSMPTLKGVTNSLLSYDFEPLLVDEWYNLDYATIVDAPPTLSFVDFQLVGVPTSSYEDTITVSFTNTNGNTNTFDIPLLISDSDPVLLTLPHTDKLTSALSANLSYGYRYDYWYDTRIVEGLTYNSEAPNYISLEGATITDTFTTESLSGKTFAWVYTQKIPGKRQLLDSFPQIRDGNYLWSVNSTNEIHGTTSVTQLTTYVHGRQVNTLNYELETDVTYIIVATHDEDSISYKSIPDIKGSLLWFSSWDVSMSEAEIHTITEELAKRFYVDLTPYIVDDSTEYFTVGTVSVDLDTKIVDLTDLTNSNLTFNLLTVHDNAVIDSNHNLTYTTSTDELLTWDIEVTSSYGTTVLTFNTQTLLRTHPLYLELSYVLNLKHLYLFEPDTVVLDGTTVNQLSDYRLNTVDFNSTTVSYDATNKLLNFNEDGNSVLNAITSLSGKTFLWYFKRNSNSIGYSFLAGQTATSNFASGLSFQVLNTNLSSSFISYLNRKIVNNSTYYPVDVDNCLILTSDTVRTIDSIAQDKLLPDRSFKGQLKAMFILEEQLTESQLDFLYTKCRDYFDVPRTVVDLDFNNQWSDINVQGNYTPDAITVYEGQASQQLNVSPLTLTHGESLAFLNEDFVMSMWIYQNQTSKYILYRQQGFELVLENNRLYVDVYDSNEYSIVTVPNTWQQILIARVKDTLYAYLDTTLFASIVFNKNLQYIENITVGETSTDKVLLDSLVIERRVAI